MPPWGQFVSRVFHLFEILCLVDLNQHVANGESAIPIERHFFYGVPRVVYG